ncbi:uncharacterized protein LOC113359148 [Papaver somniferum]|uniref:uncharacterized protein LOC113359148 n=1 Tax=Papaver somniferum TaxID=3469 RepID=UPI000E6F95FB|nr:uncharacterized protein LOC113359148 [Papaver somniferum]
MTGEKKSVHPAFAINNIKSLVPVILDIKQDEYSSWVFLFDLHLQAQRLLFLIDGSQRPTDIDADTETVRCSLSSMDVCYYDQGSYAYHSQEGKTAKEIWDHLKTLFQNNKGSRAANLESKFVNLKFSDCASVDD